MYENKTFPQSQKQAVAAQCKESHSKMFRQQHLGRNINENVLRNTNVRIGKLILKVEQCQTKIPVSNLS
jgi:hypothetical protein